MLSIVLIEIHMDKARLLQQLQQQGIHHPGVLKTLLAVPREYFVLPADKDFAYQNTALPIDCEQTISQPYIVALMTQALLAHPHPQKILEIGTGSGYQTAILASLCEKIWTIERIATLQDNAKKVLKKLQFTNIAFRCGDGAQGWDRYAPFDGIIVTAAARRLPKALVAQLAPGGIMVIPLGEGKQILTVIEKHGETITQTPIEAVRFVPLIEDR